MTTRSYPVWWSQSAQNDLESIVDFISLHSKANASALFNQIKDHCLKLERFPWVGRVPPELKEINIDSYREIIVSNWRILYKADREVHILAVIDSRRDVEDALLNRLLYRHF